MSKYWILWNTLSSKATFPKERIERLREVDPRARVPRKTLNDGVSLSNLNVRAALREFIEVNLKGLKLAPGTYLISTDYETAKKILDVIVGDKGLLEVGDVYSPVAETSLHTPIAHRFRGLMDEIQDLEYKFLLRETAFNALRIIEKADEIEEFKEAYGPLCPELSDWWVPTDTIEKVKELYNNVN